MSPTEVVRYYIRVRHAAACMCLSLLVGAGAAWAHTASGGALGLTIDDTTGRVSRIELAGESVVAASAVAASGFAVADWATDKTYRPVPMRRGDDGSWQGQQDGFQITATIAGLDGAIDVRGEVADVSAADRSLSLRFGLPVAAEGWQWSSDLDRRLPIVGAGSYTNGVSIRVGSGRLDLWPLSAISNDRATLALATRIDEPAICHGRYEGTDQLLSLTFDVALTELARKSPRRARFHFAILAADTPFGMRSGLGEYYRVWPDLFVKRTDLMGGWFAWGDILHLGPPLSDFGLMFHEGPTSEGHASDPRLGIPRYPYIEPGMFQLHFGDLDHRPDREEIMQRLREYAADCDDAGKMAQLSERDRWNRKMSRAILVSGIRDPEGEIVIAAVGQYGWVAGSRWAAQFPLLLDPDIEHGAAATYLEAMRDRVPRDDWGEGRYLDSYSAHIRSVDYAPEHLAVADFPPTFDAENRPCQLMAIPMFEYVEALGRLLDEHGKTILVNAYGHGAPFPFHRFDVLGKEHWAAASGGLFQRYRAMAYQKVVTDLPSNEPIDAQYIEEFLVYDIFPGGYGRGDWGQEKMRLDYRRVIPLLRLLHRLGWQPVTHATTPRREVKIERYGGPEGPVCLVVHNPWGGKLVEVAVDARALGLGPKAQCEELIRGDPIQWQHAGDELRLTVALGPRQTALVALGENEARARLYELLATDKLNDVAFCVKEWPLREDGAHPRAAALTGAPKLAPDGLRTLAGELAPADHALNARMRELLTEAADLKGRGASPPTLASAAELAAPEAEPAGAKLPWKETFDRLDAERWTFKEDHPGLEVRDGKLVMRLPENATSIGLSCKEPFDFGARPIELRYKFQFNHAGHQWYLMQSVRLAPTLTGGAGDYLHIRCDPGLRMRLENGLTPATDYKWSLTPYQAYETNVPHEVVLHLDGERLRMWIDDKLHGEGQHGLGFTLGYLSLGLYSGHRGHGDECWFDDLEASEVEAW